MIFCGNLHRNRDHISVNRHKFQSETRYLALHVCELRRTQEYHCSPESLSSPCRVKLNTARDSTRFFARSPFFCVYQQREERSWRPCLSAYLFGQDREFPRHSIYSVVKDHERPFLSPHFYWQKNRHFYKQNEKIFLFFAVSDRKDSLPPHFYWQEKRHRLLCVVMLVCILLFLQL